MGAPIALSTATISTPYASGLAREAGPGAVIHNGCVIARSNEATALGAEMGAPWHLCRAGFRKPASFRHSWRAPLQGTATPNTSGPPAR